MYFKKITQREFRPTHIVYIPLYIWYGFQALRFGSRGWIMASNPGLRNAGLIHEDKRTALSQFDTSIIPTSIFWKGSEPFGDILKKISSSGIQFPCIAKADISRRSQKVSIINNKEELEKLTQRGRGDIIIQEYIVGQGEFGISYARIPGEEKGRILGIMHRGFAKILGNGVATLEELVTQHPRFLLYKDIIQEQNKLMRNKIVEDGKEIIVMPFGAHSRGTVFEDWTEKVTPLLHEAIDRVAKQVKGFYIGRFDIKAMSLETMEQGNFKVLELNGVGGIPGHMYDPSYTLWQGWKILFSYRNTVSQVVSASIRIHKPPLANMREMYELVRYVFRD